MQELYGNTKKIPVKKWILSGSSWLILPISGIWMWRLHSLRSQEVILLHIRPMTASPMMASPALLQMYKGINARMRRNFCKEKPQTHWSLKGRDKRKEESRWFHVEEDRNTNVFNVWFASRHYSGWIDTTFPNPALLWEILGRSWMIPTFAKITKEILKEMGFAVTWRGDPQKFSDKDALMGCKVHVKVAKFQAEGRIWCLKKGVQRPQEGNLPHHNYSSSA